VPSSGRAPIARSTAPTRRAVTPEQFAELLRMPADVGLSYDQQRALVAIERDYLTRRADVLTAVLNEPGRMIDRDVLQDYLREAVGDPQTAGERPSRRSRAASPMRRS